MLTQMLVPLAVSAALAFAVAAVHRRLPPALAARVTTVALIVVAGAAIPTVWITGLSYLSHAPVVGGWLAWCVEAFGAHSRLSPLIGLPALALTGSGAWRAYRTLRVYRTVREERDGLEIADRAELFAFTIPGPGGRIVISRGLDDVLSPEERDVVLAHERAHGTHRHDRYLLAGQLAAALLAPLTPLVRRLQYSLERWADESAVAQCGDRELVAMTLGRVAIRTTEMQVQAGLAFTGYGVPARMAALLAPPVDHPRSLTRVLVWGVAGAAAVFASFQLHHLLGMAVALCPG